MKKLILVLTIIFVASTIHSSQKINVPEAVKDAFNKMFPDASNVKWGKENATEYEAEFKLNDVKMSANYKTDGTWVETETQIDISSLPQAVTDAINRDYPNANIIRAYKIDKADKSVLYEADIKSGKKKREVEYDTQGNKQ